MDAGIFSPLGMMLVECKALEKGSESLQAEPVWIELINPAIDEASIGLEAVTAEQAEDVLSLMICAVTTLSDDKKNGRRMVHHQTYSALADLIASATTRGRMKSLPIQYRVIVLELAKTAPKANFDLRHSLLNFTMQHAWSSQISHQILDKEKSR
jgi:hypothetical protein